MSHAKRLFGLFLVAAATIAVVISVSNVAFAGISYTDDAYSTTMTFPYPPFSATYTYVGNTASGLMQVDGGDTLTATQSYIGYTSTGSGTATVTGNGSKWTASSSGNQFTVGENGPGTLYVQNGGTVTSDGRTYIGYATGIAGVASVDGPGSALNGGNDSSLYVGYGGTGTLNISNGGLVNVAKAYTTSGLGTVNFGPGGGTLATTSLYAQPADFAGTGTIVTHGYISDTNLAFNSTTGLTQSLSGFASDVNVTLNMSNPSDVGVLGVGYMGNASLSITGTTVTSESGMLGYKSNSSGTVTVDGTNSAWTISKTGGVSSGDLAIGFAGKGLLKITNGGRVTTNGTGGGKVSVGIGSTLVVDGPGSTLVNNDTFDMAVGDFYFDVSSSLDASPAQLTITNGGFVNNTSPASSMMSPGGDTSVGSNAMVGNPLVYGIATVSGNNSIWNINANLWVGRSGNGVVNIQSGGSVSVGGATYLGIEANSTASLNFSTGTLTTKSLYDITGQYSAVSVTGSGVINARGLVSDTSLTFDGGDLVNHGLNQTSTFSGSSVSLKLNMSDSANVGDLGVGNGLLLIKGGIVVPSTNGYVSYQKSSTGTAIVDGGTWACSGAVTVGGDTSSAGTLNIQNGGVVVATSVKKGMYGSGTVYFDGGTLRANAASTSFMSGLTGAYVKASGATIDTNGYDVTVGQSLLTDGVGTGGLTKIGAGVLTVSGTNTYTGTTTISGGVLLASETASLPGYSYSNVVVQCNSAVGGCLAGAPWQSGWWTEANIGALISNANWAADGTSSLALNTGDYSGYTYASAIGNPSNKSIGLIKLGNSTLTLSVAATYGGPTAINAGVLQLGGTNYLPTNTAVVLSNAGGYNMSTYTWLSAALDLNGYNQTVDSLAGGGTTGGNVSLGTGVLTVGNTASTANTTYAGVISGDTAGGLVLGGGALTLSGANTYTGTTTVMKGVLTLVGTDMATPKAWNSVLNLGGADVQGGKLVFDYTGGTAPDIGTLMATSYHAGAWDQGQFHSTSHDSNRGLGWGDDGTSKVTVMYTLYGDSNLDGSVNGTDLNAVLSYYNQSGEVWSNGDFNYDGSVNGTDLNTVLSNYNQSLSSSTAAVPEPSTLLLLVLGLAGLLAWRKRK